MTSTRFTSRLISLCTVWLLVAGQMAAQQTPQLPNPGNPPISREQQIQLGFKAASEVYQQMPVLPDNSPETQYARQVGQKLAATIPHEYSWPFEFHVIPSQEINAFALPGGPMFVNLGAITAAGSEAELAGVMAHEMSHVYMQHSAKMIKQSTTPSIIAGLGQVLGSMIGGVGGAVAAIGGQLGGGLLSMKFSRADEAQADAVGAIIMYRAGYDPRALARFFERLETQTGKGGPQFLSDHPNPGNREQAILNEVDKWPQKRYIESTTEFTRMQSLAKQAKSYSAQQIADGAKSGEWSRLNHQNGAVFKAPPGVNVQPAQGEAGQGAPAQARPVSWNEVRPSTHMVQSNLGPLSISRPDNWEVAAPQEQGAGITIAPRAGVVGNGFGYGVMINGVQPNGGNLDQITANIAQSLSNGGDLQQAGDIQRINVGGAEGRSLMMESTSPFPTSGGGSQKERDWLVTAPASDGSSVVFFVFVAPQQDFERLRPTFEEMLRSARF